MSGNLPHLIATLSEMAIFLVATAHMLRCATNVVDAFAHLLRGATDMVDAFDRFTARSVDRSPNPT